MLVKTALQTVHLSLGARRAVVQLVIIRVLTLALSVLLEPIRQAV